MKPNYIKLNQVSIGFSVVCIVHCIASFTVLLVPLFGLWNISPGSEVDYWFHALLFFFGMPLSMLALHGGYRQHGRWPIVVAIVLGCLLLGSALFFHDETTHRLLTLTGAAILAAGHVKNLLNCRKANSTPVKETLDARYPMS